ncbi:hypothetical protein ASPZODRAFT_19858 [Penicilliopsis zonata CBS 506.65]|uniref:SMP domain-containing protein n=1 Tax=Penicilliopsis zonata CBS 506.65 TaxID=1073090 RepID=A0A1L9S7N6_9EURO|nr:hypothetical protein ASPZODRAFT_19858 [Penicilliopsis zonata CBS 506.65]OJJ43169.1 hypothetical protein ASPZODRAFT_19858 [Penicilliopsis zonata CBS 506.65]
MSTLQFRDKVHERAREGERLSDQEITSIVEQSAELGGAESDRLNVGQSAWAAWSDRILSKPANAINTADARMMHQKETRAFDNLPAQGSVASHVQSVAQKNEK